MRSATEEDYKKLGHWNVGTFHRVSISPETEQSRWEGKKNKAERENSQGKAKDSDATVQMPSILDTSSGAPQPPGSSSSKGNTSKP